MFRPGARKYEICAAIGGEGDEGAVLALPLEKIEVAERLVSARVGVAVDSGEAVRIRVRERPKKDSINDAEDACVSTNPQGQREDCNRGESRAFAQLTYCIAKVLN
jgi:hypothetical protein